MRVQCLPHPTLERKWPRTHTVRQQESACQASDAHAERRTTRAQADRWATCAHAGKRCARRQAMRARREASSHADMRTPTGKQRERMSTNERCAHADRRATSACRQASYLHACRKAIDAHARQHALTIDAHARQHALATHASGTTFALVASAWPAQTINMFPISR